jgi:hypothetical protein
MEHSMIIVGIIIGLIILLIGYLANNPDTKSIDISFYQFKVMVKKNVRRQKSISRKIVRRRNQLKQKAREAKGESAKSA